MTRIHVRSLSALSCVAFAAIFALLAWRVASLWPMYLSSEIRSQTRFVLEDARTRYGLAVSYLVPSSLRCDATRCRLILREPFNLAIDPAVRHAATISWPRDDWPAYVYATE